MKITRQNGTVSKMSKHRLKSNENHVTEWDGDKDVKAQTETEADKTGRLIAKAVCISKSSNMYQDEGDYQLSHVRDKSLLTDI